MLIHRLNRLRDRLPHRGIRRRPLYCFILLLGEEGVVSVDFCEFFVFVPPAKAGVEFGDAALIFQRHQHLLLLQLILLL